MYNQYADDIYRFIFVHVRDVDIAEDLTADTFTNAWKNIEKFDGKQPRPWLYTIARNKLNDHWRKKPTLTLDTEIEIASDMEATEVTLDRKTEQKRIVKAVNTLPKDMKSVVTLRFLQGFSAKETGKALQLSESNVRVIQYRALKKLKERLS